MALRESVELEIQGALRELERLRQQLTELGAPVNVPVNVQGEEELARLEQQVRDAGGVVDVDVPTGELRGAENTVEELNRELERTDDELRAATREADRFGNEMQTSGQRGVQAVGGIRASLGPLLAGAAAGIGFGALARQFQAAVDSATALEESINAVQVTFGEGAQDVLAFGESAAESVGLAASEFNQLVVPIGALLQNFELDGQEAADAANELTQRAADMASVFNTEVSDALGAVGAALRGETEPIRRFGVNLNQAALDAKALELGLVDVGEEVSIAQRGQAAYAEVLEQTSRFAGDFERTSESAANQQRILSARVEETRAEIGEALLPTFQRLLDAANNLLPAVENLAPAFGSIGTAIFDILDDVATVASGLFDIGEALAGVATEIGELPGEADLIANLREDASQAVNPLAGAAQNVRDIRSLLTTGATEQSLVRLLEDVAEEAENTSDPLRLVSDEFERLRDEGIDAVRVLGDLGAAAGVGDEEFRRFVEGLILSADRLGFSNEQVLILRDLLSDIGGTALGGGALVGFENLAGGIEEVNVALSGLEVAGADRALLNLASGFDEVAESQLPTVIRGLEDLDLAADEADVSVTEFVENLPDDVTLNLSDAEREVLDLVGALEEASARLEEIDVGAAFGDVGEVDEDTGKIVGDIDQFLTDLEERGGELADLDFDLSQIQLVAPNLAQLLADSGLEAADIAAAFAENLDRAAEAAALLEGTEGLAAATAEQYAGFLRDLTPDQVAELGAFGADNFLSPAIRSQLADTASEAAGLISEGFADSDQLILDLTNADIGDLSVPAQTIAQQLSQLISENIRLDPSLFSTEGANPSGGSVPGSTTPGTEAPGAGAANYEININNPTTEDLTTGATQAVQTIQAVGNSMRSVR